MTLLCLMLAAAPLEQDSLRQAEIEAAKVRTLLDVRRCEDLAKCPPCHVTVCPEPTLGELEARVSNLRQADGAVVGSVSLCRVDGECLASAPFTVELQTPAVEMHTPRWVVLAGLTGIMALAAGITIAIAGGGS